MTSQSHQDLVARPLRRSNGRSTISITPAPRTRYARGWSRAAAPRRACMATRSKSARSGRDSTASRSAESRFVACSSVVLSVCLSAFFLSFRRTRLPACGASRLCAFLSPAARRAITTGPSSDGVSFSARAPPPRAASGARRTTTTVDRASTMTCLPLCCPAARRSFLPRARAPVCLARVRERR